MFFFRYFSILFFLVFFYACENCDDILIDSYILSEVSLNNRPYLEIDSIIFINEDSLENIFVVGEYSSEIKESKISDNSCGTGFANKSGFEFFEYESQSIVLHGSTEKLHIELRTSWVSTDSTRENLNKYNHTIFDHLNMGINSVDKPGLIAFVDFRDSSEEEVFNKPFNEPFSYYYSSNLTIINSRTLDDYLIDTTILGKELQQVYHKTSNDSIAIYYSKENGIEAFFTNGEMWVLDRMY